jgi:hypothetical protein
MRGVSLPTFPSRIRGRDSLLRRLRGLTIAAHRFGRGRARSRADQLFAARLIDGLTRTLEAVDPAGAPHTAIDAREDARC